MECTNRANPCIVIDSYSAARRRRSHSSATSPMFLGVASLIHAMKVRSNLNSAPARASEEPAHGLRIAVGLVHRRRARDRAVVPIAAHPRFLVAQLQRNCRSPGGSVVESSLRTRYSGCGKRYSIAARRSECTAPSSAAARAYAQCRAASRMAGRPSHGPACHDSYCGRSEVPAAHAQPDPVNSAQHSVRWVAARSRQ
nr:hypothetical protein BN444_02097 [Xanthomonas translucens pv. translucens DSM 18974]